MLDLTDTSNESHSILVVLREMKHHPHDSDCFLLVAPVTKFLQAFSVATYRETIRSMVEML